MIIPCSQFVTDHLFPLTRSTFASIEYFGPVSFAVVKDNPYLGAMVKRKYLLGLNWSYEDCVNRARKRHKNFKPFKAGNRSWGTYVLDGNRQTIVVEHKGEYYLHGILVRAGASHFSLRGRAIAKSLIDPFLKKRPAVAASQELKDEWAVQVRDFRMDHIQRFKEGGKVFLIR